jgi:hypothetical protein
MAAMPYWLKKCLPGSTCTRRVSEIKVREGNPSFRRREGRSQNGDVHGDEIDLFASPVRPRLPKQKKRLA